MSGCSNVLDWKPSEQVVLGCSSPLSSLLVEYMHPGIAMIGHWKAYTGYEGEMEESPDSPMATDSGV